MVTTQIMALSGACIVKCGSGVSTDLTTGSPDTLYWDVFIRQAESTINTICRYNFSDAYGALSIDVKYILEAYVSSYAANLGIQYDMSGYTSNIEAAKMLDVNRDIMLTAQSLLRDKDTQAFVVDPTKGTV